MGAEKKTGAGGHAENRHPLTPSSRRVVICPNKQRRFKDGWGKDGWGKEGWGKDGWGKDGWGKDGKGKDFWGMAPHPGFAEGSMQQPMQGSMPQARRCSLLSQRIDAENAHFFLRGGDEKRMNENPSLLAQEYNSNRKRCPGFKETPSLAGFPL